MNDEGERGARGGGADAAVRAPIERVAAAICAATGVSWTSDDSTTPRLVETVVSEYHASVGDGGEVEFDPETGEFRSTDGDIRLEIDRFPVDTKRWELLVGLVAVAGLVGLAAAYVGVFESAAWLAVGALGFVTAGAAVRGAARADVSVAAPSDD